MSGSKLPKARKHFVLVHGACRVNQKQVFEIPHLSDYLSPLMEFMTFLPVDEQVILVGHSLDGFSISKAMERFLEKISVAIFVTTIMPGPALDAATVSNESSNGAIFQLDNRLTFDNELANPPTTFSFGPKYLASYLHPLSPIQDWALDTTIVRPIYFYGLDDISKEIVLSSKKYGSVRRAYIVVPEDKNPPDQVEEISGSYHMPIMSKPHYLFTLLMRIANK
ncbi:unnamed protein product [Withania somnifera]